MLKWTVMARRDAADRPVASRRLSESAATSANRRRSSSHRNNTRKSLDLIDLDKENRFTSTPIKSTDHQIDALRDVGNLTPSAKDILANGHHHRFPTSAKKPTPSPGRRKRKKKKSCLDPDQHHHQGKNYFKPFEAVDSHIKGLPDDEDEPCNSSSNKRRLIQDTYFAAPTLPTFAIEYSPCVRNKCLYNGSPRATPLAKFLEQEYVHHPSKRARMDHVNDFLHQITFITSPDDERDDAGAKLAAMELKSTGLMMVRPDEVKVSPLVKKFVDLRFSQISFDAGKNFDNNNGSSSMDEMSLDKIVDAILDSSAESIKSQRVNLESTTISSAAQGKCISKCDKTIINVNETFNERCVDIAAIKSRLRQNTPLQPPPQKEEQGRKRPFPPAADNNDKSDDDYINFTLKRQRCIRRRHKVEDDKDINKEQVNNIGRDGEVPSPVLQPFDDSFDSLNISGHISADKKSTPVDEGKKFGNDETFTVQATPSVESSRRFRRCLLFESPTTSEFNEVSTPDLVGEIRGSMDLHVHYENEELHLNIIRCRDLVRSSGKQINAYVKVALGGQSEDSHISSRNKLNGLAQRTAVHKDSSWPFFNHTFKFSLIENPTTTKRLHIEVWHRDRSLRTSEFLGCMSFDVRHAYKKDISGSYRLLPHSSGRHQNVPITTDTTHHLPMGDSHSEEAFSLDDLDPDLRRSATATATTTATSRSALSEQQKHADENLFLRYLELDPTEGPDAIPAATQRKATGNRNGRTPFTQTKRLLKTGGGKSGFGFSVVWTHPPRIERVEKGLPADKAGILPGDYVIFVDKHNVVMTPEIDILNLIRSYGSQLTLEIFRRNTSRNGSVPSVARLNSVGTGSMAGLPVTLAGSNLEQPQMLQGLQQQQQQQRRPSTVCSTTNTMSVDYNRRKLHLPQVTFSAEKSTSNNQDENRKRSMYQLISKEQQYATGLQFALTRFVSALAERKDLITPSEHRILFQNSEEILRITEDILDNIVQDDGEPQTQLLVRTYQAKLNDLTSAYKRYCSGIKKADCVLANKTRDSNSEFVRFLQTPSIPRRRPDITTFIHKPLEHFREVLKLLTVIQVGTKPSHEDFPVINRLVHDLQVSYKQITAEAGLMEPMGEGRPLLTVQDLENRLVFTKCKPFVLNKPGRQWIFGGDLGRVEGRNVRQYWTLLFSDLLLFAKVSRDRVLFVIEDPLPLTHITDMFFNIRKKDTEFRITMMPGGRPATSPTVHCGPDLTRTPKKSACKKTIVLRAPSVELKAVWQNLLQRQIFHINSGMDGSSFSSPLDSPDVPITSSVATTLQSAESLSYHRRQTPQNINETEIQKQIDALIEHKCKQLSKSNSGSKGNAIHLEKWIKSQLYPAAVEEAEMEESFADLWTEDMLRKRSEELRLIDAQGNITTACRNEAKPVNPKFEDINLSDHDQSPSKSTTTGSQVTVRSSPLVPETVPVCRQCHKNCVANNIHNNNKEHEEDDWRPFLLMGLSAINPAASLVKLDPFAAPVPQINVAPPTPEVSRTANKCNCISKPQITTLIDLKENSFDCSPDDSPQTEEHPYHSLSSSNLTLRRFGTVSSLERLGDDNNDPTWDDQNNSSDSEAQSEGGIDNDAFYRSSIRNWTAKAGSFVAEKMSFFEKLGEDYKNTTFFERYLKSSEMNGGDDLQEDETSGATSGEEIWGTPTSGGEIDDPLSSPNYEGKHSPYDGSISSDNGDDTEMMMDELLMTPPISGAFMRGLLPRRTLEPLIEEDGSESYSSPSSGTPTEPSVSPEQGNGTGNAADKCSTAAEGPTPATPEAAVVPKIHRSESYRRIVEAAEDEEDQVGFFGRFRPTVKFINIERVPRAKSVRIFEFFNMRRERRIHQTIEEDRQLIKVFSKEGTISDNVPTSYSEKPVSPRRLKDKQMDRRFWKQLSKRRSGKPSSNSEA